MVTLVPLLQSPSKQFRHRVGGDNRHKKATRSIFLDVDVNDDGGDPNLLLLKGTPVIYGKYTEG